MYCSMSDYAIPEKDMNLLISFLDESLSKKSLDFFKKKTIKLEDEFDSVVIRNTLFNVLNIFDIIDELHIGLLVDKISSFCYDVLSIIKNNIDYSSSIIEPVLCFITYFISRYNIITKYSDENCSYNMLKSLFNLDEDICNELLDNYNHNITPIVSVYNKYIIRIGDYIDVKEIESPRVSAYAAFKGQLMRSRDLLTMKG